MQTMSHWAFIIYMYNIHIQLAKQHKGDEWQQSCITKKIAIDDKVIIITVKCWACNIKRCNMYNKITTERGEKDQNCIEITFIYLTRIELAYI